MRRGWCFGVGGGGWGRLNYFDDPIIMSSYDPYAPTPDAADGGETIQCGGDGSGGGRTCFWEWMVIEVSLDGGMNWEPWWSGWGQVCYYNDM
jgi:hypothetical protein